jgi:hypothetical protein
VKLSQEIIYFIFPLLFAGLIHHLLVIHYDLLSFLKLPIDGGIKFRGKPLFGKSKTLRGFVVVPILSSIGMLLISKFITVDSAIRPLALGFYTGLGYCLAELPNSFMKRRMGIPEGLKANGRSKFLFSVVDQFDSILGALIVLTFFYPVTPELFLSLLIIGGLIHYIVDLCLYKYSYKKSLKKSYQ